MRWTSTGSWSAEDLAALQALSALPGGYLPWTIFAMRPAALAAVLDEVALARPRCILELGSGLSTVFLARLLRQQRRSDAVVISVDDAPPWVEQVRDHLERERLTDLVELVSAPRAPWSAPDRDAPRPSPPERAVRAVLRRPARPPKPLPDRWYAREPIREAIGSRTVDFMLVDGPKGRRTISRYPALPEMLAHLHEDATVVLDDASRAGEREVVERWSRSTDFTFVTHRDVGLAVGRRP